jgi:hypothetical protein
MIDCPKLMPTINPIIVDAQLLIPLLRGARGVFPLYQNYLIMPTVIPSAVEGQVIINGSDFEHSCDSFNV